MKSTSRNFLIAFAVFACIVFIGTCTLNQRPPEKLSSPLADSLLNEIKHEKEQQEIAFRWKLKNLRIKSDSLLSEVKRNKKVLQTYRVKASGLEKQLRDALTKADTNRFVSDTLVPIVNTYIENEELKDSSCDSTINTLENIIGNRDSSLVIQKGIENNLRDFQKEQELQVRLLTDQLNTAYKAQKRKTIQNKFLAGALILLSGISTSFLITQTLK